MKINCYYCEATTQTKNPRQRGWLPATEVLKDTPYIPVITTKTGFSYSAWVCPDCIRDIESEFEDL